MAGFVGFDFLTGLGARGGDGGSPVPSWLEGATAGVNFQTKQAWLNGALVTDLTTQLDGVDLSAFTDDGMPVVTDGTNWPVLKGALLALVAAGNWTFLNKCISTVPVQPDLTQREYLAVSEGAWSEASNYLDSALFIAEGLYVGGLNGSYEPDGPVPYPNTAPVLIGANKLAMRVADVVSVCANGDAVQVGETTKTGTYDTAHYGFGAFTVDDHDEPVNLISSVWLFYPGDLSDAAMQALTA